MTEKLDMTTPDGVTQNIEHIAALFPNCVTETAEGKAIDFDLLRQELSRDIVEGPKERYRLEWPGKREAIVTANMPTTNTLRPVREDSVNFDTTENLYIEGDNLEVLKLLQESYLGKVKMIYIDPPYNTGNDFVYRDNFAQNTDEFKADSGMTDELGNRLVANPETAGRYHSDWLTMMYPRLKLARNLMIDEGVIFISIDDNELYNLKKICDEIYGEFNYRGTVVRATGQTTGQDSGGLGSSFDYILVYTKEALIDLGGLPLTEHDLKRFENEDSRGKYAYDQMRKTGSNDKRTDRPNMFYSIKDPDGNDIYPIAPAGYESCWRFERKTYEKLLSEDFILWKKSKRGDDEIWWPYVKYYLEGRTKRPSPLWTTLEGNKKAARDLREVLGEKYFDFPKPIELLTTLLQIVPNNEDNQMIVLDFFSGSATTAHGVMQLNAEDGGNRKFIMVQLPEKTDEKSEAYKAGYHNICEIGKERIRRAGAKIVETQGIASKKEQGKGVSLFDTEHETQNKITDIGFRVYRLDTSNMQDVYYRPQDYKQEMMDELFANHIKPERTADDLVSQVMLDWGLPLSLPIEKTEITGKTVYKVDGNALYCCFDDNIDEAFARAAAAFAPLRIVFHDHSFASDTAKENVRQLLKQLSNDTEMKVV